MNSYIKIFLISLMLAVGPMASPERVATAQAPQPKPTPPAPAPTPQPQPAATAAIVVPSAIHPYGLVKLSLSGGAFDDVDWEILYIPDLTVSVDSVETAANGSSCVFAGPPGAYRLTAWMTSSSQVSHVTASATIPGTPPAPSPPPTPVTGKFWAVGVFDLSTLFSLPPGQQAIFASTSIPASLNPLGGYWSKFDTSSPDVTSAGPQWAQAALKTGLPALVLVNGDGTVASSQTLPADEAGVMAVVQASMGGQRRPAARIGN
jgi:hypothetical protein